jgi:hypothetical protein
VSTQMRKVKASLLMAIGELDLEIVECQAEHQEFKHLEVLRTLLYACTDFLKGKDTQKLRDAIPEDAPNGDQ